MPEYNNNVETTDTHEGVLYIWWVEFDSHIASDDLLYDLFYLLIFLCHTHLFRISTAKSHLALPKYFN